MAALRQSVVYSLLSRASFTPGAVSPLWAPTVFQKLIRPTERAPLFPPSLRFDIPSILSGLWESILRAVPKKKTSHRKKRQRFLAGKALKDVTALNKCSACGNAKRAHLLCPFCVDGNS